MYQSVCHTFAFVAFLCSYLFTWWFWLEFRACSTAVGYECLKTAYGKDDGDGGGGGGDGEDDDDDGASYGGEGVSGGHNDG